MLRFWHGIWSTLLGLWELLRLALLTKFRLRGAYWTWRWQTALGPQAHTISPGQRFRAMLEYGRWVASMRRV